MVLGTIILIPCLQSLPIFSSFSLTTLLGIFSFESVTNHAGAEAPDLVLETGEKRHLLGYSLCTKSEQLMSAFILHV